MNDEITPHTKVSMSVKLLLTTLASLATVLGLGFKGYYTIDWTLRSQGERLAAIDGKISQFSPAQVRDEARRVCREVLGKETLGCSCVRAHGGSQLTCQCHAREEQRDE
jgi:hypothetical protein